MEDEVEFEIVADEGTLLSDELLLDIVVFDYLVVGDPDSALPDITIKEVRGSQALLTSENSSKRLILQLLSETVIPKFYYYDGIESELIEKIQKMVLKSLHGNATASDAEKTARSIVEDMMLTSLHRRCNIAGHQMSIHIIVFKNCCRYYVINSGGVANTWDLTICLSYMERFAECSLASYSLLASTKKRMKIESIECSVCLQEIMSNGAFGFLSCSHVYHYLCICKWLRRSPICPLCRSQASLLSLMFTNNRRDKPLNAHTQSIKFDLRI